MVKKESGSFVKIGMVYIVSNIIIKGMAFLTTPIFTRWMSQEQYGSFSNISSWANIISIVVTLCLYSSISRAKYDYDEKMNEYMSTITVLGSICTLLVWLAVELNIDAFESLFNMNRVYIRSIMLYSLFSPAVQVLIAKCRMYNEYKSVIALTWITLFVTTIASLGLTFVMQDKLAGRVAGTYTVIAIVDVLFWIYVIVRGKTFSIQMCKYACALSLPLLVHELSGVLLNSSDRIIINQLCGEREAALYSIAYTVAMILTVIMSSINQAWVPWFFDKLSIHDDESIKAIVPKYALIFTIGCVGIMFIGPELIMIFGGSAYMEAIYVIPPVCLAIELQFVYTLYVNIEFYLKKTTWISIATFCATIINILLNYLFIPYFGYIVAAYTTVVGYLYAMILHYCVCKKTEYKMIFSMKTLMLYVGICGIGMLLSLTLYSYNFIRVILIAIITLMTAVVFAIKRKKIVQIIKKVLS